MLTLYNAHTKTVVKNALSDFNLVFRIKLSSYMEFMNATFGKLLEFLWVIKFVFYHAYKFMNKRGDELRIGIASDVFL